MTTTYNEGAVRPYTDMLLFPTETKIRRLYSPISVKDHNYLDKANQETLNVVVVKISRISDIHSDHTAQHND